MTAITLRISVPTSTNDLHTGTGKNKRRTPEYDQWLKKAGWEVRAQLSKAKIKRLVNGPWWSDIQLSEHDKADPDNRLKACHDLLVGLGTVPDDKHLKGGSYDKVGAVEKGFAVVTVSDAPLRDPCPVCVPFRGYVS